MKKILITTVKIVTLPFLMFILVLCIAHDITTECYDSIIKEFKNRLK